MSMDPFFDELRHRLPDVDIVALPPDAAPRTVDPADATVRTDASVADVRAALVAAWPRLCVGLPRPRTAELSWQAGMAAGTVVARLRAVAHDPSGPLARLATLTSSSPGLDTATALRQHGDTAVLRQPVGPDGVRVVIIAQDVGATWTVQADGPPVDLGTLADTWRRTPPRELPWEDPPR